MGRLKLFPPERLEGGAGEDEPAVVSFARLTSRFRRNRPIDVVTRARIVHTNSRCPVCRHPVIEPIELNDGLRGRSHLPIPGTATLVGFRCERCDLEWPA